MASIPANAAPRGQAGALARAGSLLQRQGVLIALVLLILFGALRYDNFLSVYNISNLLRYNSMFGLIGLGMTFVIMTGGIDLSVGAIVALASVLAALYSPYGVLPAVLAALLGGLILGAINGVIIARLGILPFIVTLAMLLAARGLALIFGNNTSVAVSSEPNLINLPAGALFGLTPAIVVPAPFAGGLAYLGQGDFLGIPVPALIMVLAFGLGSLLLNFARFGRHVLALGGNEEAARLMGLPVDRIKLLVYILSGLLAALAGVILAAQFNTGQPTEGVGWELSAIAAVVVGGTLLTGGMGSVGTTLVGVLLLGLIFNILNFENGRGFISLSVYWQSVIRGAFLLVVVLVQNRLTQRRA